MRYLLIAVVAAAVAFVIVHHSGRELETSSNLTSRAPSSALSKRATVVPARALPAAPAFDPPPVVETDDASVPVAPVLDPETFTLAREAVMPVVRACADSAGDARVAVTVRVEVGQGRIRIGDARSDTAAVAACVTQAAQTLELAAPTDQPDGAHRR
jgi:hypothetical protein